MPTLEQIDRGAAYYERKMRDAMDAHMEHIGLGSPHASRWADAAAEYARICASLRALAESDNPPPLGRDPAMRTNHPTPKERPMWHRLLRCLNPLSPLSDLVDDWSRHEKRKIAYRILDRERPGRTHTPCEWDALVDEVVESLEKQKQNKKWQERTTAAAVRMRSPP